MKILDELDSLADGAAPKSAATMDKSLSDADLLKIQVEFMRAANPKTVKALVKVVRSAMALRGDLMADDDANLPDHFVSWHRLGDSLKQLEALDGQVG